MATASVIDQDTVYDFSSLPGHCRTQSKCQLSQNSSQYLANSQTLQCACMGKQAKSHNVNIKNISCLCFERDKKCLCGHEDYPSLHCQRVGFISKMQGFHNAKQKTIKKRRRHYFTTTLNFPYTCNLPPQLPSIVTGYNCECSTRHGAQQTTASSTHTKRNLRAKSEGPLLMADITTETTRRKNNVSICDTASLHSSALTITLLFLVVFLTSAPLPSRSETVKKVSIHALIPHHFGMTSDLRREYRSTVINFRRDSRNRKLMHFFLPQEDLTFISDDTPKEILNAFCDGILANHAVTILNVNNPLGIRRRASSNEYILELASYLGIPVISWDTQFSGASHMAAAHRTLQLAPTIEHQAMAMFSLLERYNWTTFTIVTSQVAGDAEFVASIEHLVDLHNQKSVLSPADAKIQPMEILSTIHIRELEDVKKELAKEVGSDTRVFLLHSSSRASYDIIEAAAALGLAGRDFVWILTRSSIPTGKYGTASFPVGLMGVSFEYDVEAMKRVVRAGVKTWLYALLDMAHRPSVFSNITMPPDFTCDTETDVYWKDGDVLYRHMLNVSIRDEPQIVFNENGTLTQTEIVIINLQWSDGRKERTVWNEVGRWKRHGLVMQHITWPGESPIPPTGRPKRSFLRVATLNELPYVIYRMPEEDGVCEEKTMPCWVYPRAENKERLSNQTMLRCCTGLSMDLLKILSTQLNFDFEIKEVEDGKWGGFNKQSKQWNGLVKALLDDQADIVMTSIKINPERSEAIRFSVPYLETGIKIVVALRDGAISPTAFLEPFDFFSWILIVLLSVHVMAAIIFIFECVLPQSGTVRQEPYDYASWSLILIFSVHATGSSILIFEWLSPYGLNRGQTPMREHKFSLFRSFWLIWAMLFSTSVQTDTPKGIASRFLANIWALFALVFLASYTANLAAFMITKEEFYDLSGIQDIRLQNPYSLNPPFKYATIPNGSTEANIRANHEEMYNYMKAYNSPDVDAGIANLKQGNIQAFIYDSSVLEYYASRDPKCRLVTVGNRYAMTGYGVGFPPNFNNPWIAKVDKVILKLQENGELDRLQKFWLAGACDMKKEKGVSNRTLGILNFTSAFILLGTGVLLGLLILLFEHLYFMFGRKYLRKVDKCGCCALVSLSMGKSLQLKDYVDEAIHIYTKNRCKDPVCEIQIWKLRHQLDMALLKIDNLHSQLRITGNETLMLMPSSTVEHEVSSPSGQNSVAVRVNGTRRPNASSSGRSGTRDASGKEKRKVTSRTSPTKSIPVASNSQDSVDIPEVVLSSNSNAMDMGSMEEKFERFMENMEKLDNSASTDNFSDPLLPPPPYGESPLLGEESGGGGGGSSYGGDTYIGFDDFSSDGGSARGGNVMSGTSGAAGTSPVHMLRRTPSYTSAVGLNTDVSRDASPTVAPRVRQYDGKKYVGVDNRSSVT